MGIIISRRDIPKRRLQHMRGQVVAACGCFDIFHIGHLEYLQQAARLGSVLFVGVNSDRSVWLNKGHVPRFTLEDRLRVLAALSCVDYVFSFPEKTFSHSLRLLRPDVLARGADGRDKGFPEKRTAAALGVKIAHAGEQKRASSSRLGEFLDRGERAGTDAPSVVKPGR